MALIRLNSASISFGDQPVLDGVDLAIDADQRIALVGRNGTGKSTLLKILAGMIKPDSGERTTVKNLRLAYLQQDVPVDLEGSIYSVVASGLADLGTLLSEFQATTQLLADPAGHDLPALQDKLAKQQEQLDNNDGWRLQSQVEETLSRLQLDGNQRFEQLSGGLKRRVLLGRALLQDPQILLLDEPTNHLDIESVTWLEKYLSGLRCTIAFVTHDRAFLESLANRIIDLDRGHISDWPGNYQRYLQGKADLLKNEEESNALFDKKLAQEETWIRQGIKARRTRNEGRVRALKKLRQEHAQRRNLSGNANMQVNQAARSGKKVIEASNISFGFEDKKLVSNFSLTLMRGDKLGLIGPNGVGKSTLVNLLLGKLEPQQGEIKHGTNLEIAYFDQMRSVLRPDLSAQDNVSGGKDMIEINGETRHIIGYMQEFLFSPERARAPITALSGGETNRLMLAKLFLQPSNVLVLDEPTNDLDIETLELLEDLLANYPGTVILISHDRSFIDNVVTSTIVFNGSGKLAEFVGGYTDWLQQSGQSGKVASSAKKKSGGKNSQGKAAQSSKQPSAQIEKANDPEKSAKPIKLSYKLQRELEQLPQQIDKLEEEISQLEKTMSDPDFYKNQDTDDSSFNDTVERARQAAAELDLAYQRWDELESMKTPE